MVDPEQLAVIVENLIVVLQRQAKDLEKLIAHVEQITRHLPEGSQIAVVASELSSLHVRIRKLISP